MNVAIIGGGPSGLAAAYELQKSGISITLYEVSPKVGGLAKTINLLGKDLEMGAHFFRLSYFKDFQAQIPQLNSVSFHKLKRNTGILFANKIFNYPPSLSDLINNFSIPDIVKFGGSMIASKLSGHREQKNTRDFLTYQMGEAFYEHFFDPYILKIWNKKGELLHTVFSESLIGARVISVKQIISGFLVKGKVDESGYSTIIYPDNGFSEIWDTMANTIFEMGGRILTNTRINEISTCDEGFKIASTNPDVKEKTFDHIVSTIPPILLSKLFPSNPRLKQLEVTLSYRNVVFVYLKAKLSKPFLPHCLYLYDAGTPISRVTCFTNFMADPDGFTYLSLEYWVDDLSEKWINSKELLITDAHKELQNLSPFIGIEILDGEVMKIKNAYLIPNLAMPESMNGFRDEFNKIENLHLTGRNQAKNFNYSIEDAINDGFATAKEILSVL
jgi:protoporphyrinogen oxidase